MGKKIQREFRTTKLSTSEIKRDKELRSQIEGEFPPTPAKRTADENSLSAALKKAIEESDQSEYQIAKAAGVSQIVISRFLSGERDIRMATADKLVSALGMKFGSTV